MAEAASTDARAFARALEGPIERDALWTAFLAYFRSQAVRRVAYVHFPPVGAPDAQFTRVRSEGFCDEWMLRYVAERLYRVDPFALFSQQSTEPFFWSDVRRLKQLTRGERAYLAALDRADLGDGLGIQVFGPGGRNGYVAIGLDPEGPKPSGLAIREFQWVCQLGHLRACALVATQQLPVPALSERERDILGWLARGKSNAVIAEILGLSAHTVDTYVRRIYQKLDVSDRVSAAVRGIGIGLIHGEA